jgi:hypothetical protein
MTTTTDAMICTSCKKPKASLKQKKSRALPGVQMYLCQDCLDNKREPRAFLILAGRAAADRGENPIDVLSYWIKNHRYLGEAITLRELT